MRFSDRTAAGTALGNELAHSVGEETIVLGLPRGGVEVGAQVAAKLGVPLDLAVVRKVGHPANAEFALGAVMEDGTVLIEPEHASGVDVGWLEAEIQRRTAEARELRNRYTPGETCPDLRGKRVVLVDDGAATGLTVRAAIAFAKKHGAKKVIVGLPVAPKDTVAVLRTEADEVVTVHVPEHFVGSVGAYYEDFHPLSDDEVIALLGAFRRPVV